MRHRRDLGAAWLLALATGSCVSLTPDAPPRVDATADADRTHDAAGDTPRDVPFDGARDGATFDAADGAGDGVVGDAARPFEPEANVTLPPVSRFTTIRIPPGVTVTPRPGGDGTLELWATGEVTIEGTIDVSGGNGGDGIVLGCGAGQFLGAGSGGDTALPGAAATGVVGRCGPGGGGGSGVSGEMMGSRDGGCPRGGVYGGGAGGEYCGMFAITGGGGGGGYAGGGGGGGANMAYMPTRGGLGASNEGTKAGAGSGGGSGFGGYAGRPGALVFSLDCNGWPVDRMGAGGGGGGGSIGGRAAADLPVATTFRPGSGGGGGGSVCLYGLAAPPACPPAGHRPSSGGGGGGGGGALRIVSATRITVPGSLLAKGGNGGRGNEGRSGGGGGGSGGVIYLQAPAITITGRVDASGGAGGASARPEGMPTCNTSGGEGGLGRIRLSVRTTSCTLTGGVFSPPLVTGSRCDLTPDGGVIERVYIGEYPN